MSDEKPDVQIELRVAMRSAAGTAVPDVVTVPRSEWDAMTPRQRRQFCEEQVQNLIDNEVEAGYSLGVDAGSDEV